VIGSKLQSDPPSDGQPQAFVLRIRALGPRGAGRFVFEVDDVQTSVVWRELSLERAFARIRAAVDPNLNLHAGPDGRPGKPI